MPAQGASAVLLAEPYLLPAVEQAGLDLPFIYDAFNVEADLKAAALPSSPVGSRSAVRGGRCRTAGGPRCGNHDDLLRRGRRRTGGALRPAASGLRRDPERDRHPRPGRDAMQERSAAAARWCDHFALNGIDGRRPAHLALFFASWHPPNIDAAELVISVAPQLPRRVVPARRQPRRGVCQPGRTPQRRVLRRGCGPGQTALLGCVDVALNPMRTGSGTNLKLIEYLACGVPAVSTPFGVRGLAVVDGDPPAHRLRPTGSRARFERRSTTPLRRTSAPRPAASWHGSSMTGTGLGDRLATVLDDVLAGRRIAAVPATR